MQHQIQVAFQTGGVADHDDRIRLGETEKIAGHFLLGGVSQQGIGAGNIHQHIVVGGGGAITLGVGHRLAWPVAGVLLHAGQAVEQGALAHIGIARQSDHPILWPPLQHGQSAVPSAGSRGVLGQSHLAAPLSKESPRCVGYLPPE